MTMSNFTLLAMQAALFGKSGGSFGTFTNPPSIFFGLSQTAPNKDGSNITEPSTVGTNYARLALTDVDFNDPAIANDVSSITNDGLKLFADPSGSWGMLTHLVWMDSATVGAGNMIEFFALTNPRTPDVGQRAQILDQEFDSELA